MCPPRIALLSLCLSFTAVAGERRIAAILIPMDNGAEQQSLKLEGFIDEALNEFQGLTVKTSDELFGVTADEDAAASYKRAEQGFAESRAAFEGKQYEDAERKLRATIKEYGKSVAAMRTCGNLCEAVAMYAAVLQARGDSEEAKVAILDLLALGPTFELDKKRYPQNFLALKAQVAGTRNALLRGNIRVKSKPAGARVYLNGELQGYTPMTIQTVPVGKSMLKLERPGFKQVGLLVEVSPEDLDVDQALTVSDSYKAYDSLLDRLAGEALKDKGGSTMSAMARTLGVDRAIIGVMKELEANGASELTLIYTDLKSGKRLGAKRATFQGDEYGQLKSETHRMVNALLNLSEGGGEARVHSSDPLDNRHGTEDWSAEDRGGQTTKRDKKKKGAGDPLDERSGMEDW
jgi:hypothetical protein